MYKVGESEKTTLFLVDTAGGVGARHASSSQLFEFLFLRVKFVIFVKSEVKSKYGDSDTD